MTLDSQTANAFRSGGHVDFAYYISGGSDLDHTYRFTNRSDVTKHVRSGHCFAYFGEDPLVWWTWRDSNPRPLACEASALTS